MNAKKLTFNAIPIYTILPLTALLCEYNKIFANDFKLFNVILYVQTVEFMVFIDHYYFLHKWNHLHHKIHHLFRQKKDINIWVAYAFYPFDGLSQGMPIIYAALLIPVHFYVVCFMILLVGIWTLYIHTDSICLPYPFMGCDYHLIHHQKNWYNFGLFTVLWDTIWGTIEYPSLQYRKVQTKA
tara:strand:- start:1033 stop:1581 length:549 start_codon:yes stop_codon:yes gene_type:complete